MKMPTISDPLEILVLVVGGLVVLLMAGDRLAQVFNRSLGPAYDASQLLAALTGVILHSLLAGGGSWTLRFTAICLLLPYSIELIGQRSSFPFGRYRYTEASGPKLPGGVPLGVLLMWWMLLYASLLSSLALVRILGIFPASLLTVASFTALFATAWDLAGDPVAVDGKLWTWEKRGRWLGIPWTNYAGWFVTGLLTAALGLKTAGGMSGLGHRPDWLFFLPILGFAALHLHFAGAAKRRGLPPAAVVALTLALVHIVLYSLILFL